MVPQLRRILATGDAKLRARTQKSFGLVSSLDPNLAATTTDKAAIDSLRDTLDAYDNFKRLKRARALQGKSDLTSAEKELLKAYGDDENLAPYLSSPSPSA